jgi:hypothetical protein
MGGMQWYLMHEGKTAGPVDGEEIFRLGKAGELFPSMHVRDEAGAWAPILQSPFASVVTIVEPRLAAKPQTAGAAASLKRIAIGVVVVIVGLIAALMVAVAIGRAVSKRPAAPPLPVVEAVAEAPKPKVVTPVERLARVGTLAEAITIAKPMMDDTQGEQVSPGAAVLALWWSQHSDRWTELMAMPDTRRADILKDPDFYRGRRICMTGTVVQIFRDKTAGSPAPIYLGVMSHGYANFVRFLAVQSTHGVVEDTAARFCGIAIGTQSYPNVSGGTTIAVQVVGEFDIPANGGKGLPQNDEW